MNETAPPSGPKKVATTTATGAGAGIGVFGVLLYQKAFHEQLDGVTAAAVAGAFATLANYWWHVATTLINRRFNIPED